MDRLLLFCLFFNVGKILTNPLDVYPYYPIILGLLIHFIYKHNKYSRHLFIWLSILFIIGVVNVYLGNSYSTDFLKTWISVAIFYSFYFYVIKDYNYNIQYIFNLYMNGSFWVAIIGCLQIVSHQVGFAPGYDYSWIGLQGVKSFGFEEDGLLGFYPVHSLYGEPAHFGHGMAPAYFVSLHNLIKNDAAFISRRKSLIILIATIFTSSFTSYFGIVVSILIIVMSAGSFLSRFFIFLLFSMCLIILTNFNKRVSDRIEVIGSLLSSDSFIFDDKVAETVGGFRIIINNTFVAFSNFKDHIIFGTGLGSHPYAYMKYTKIPWFSEDFLMNYNDANSLGNRIVSEMGLLGILGIIYFLFINRIKFSYKNPNLSIINSASLVMLFTFLLRQGHYFSYGLPLFLFFYYYSSKLVKSNRF